MNEQIQFLDMNISVSEYDSEILRGFHARPQEPGMQENSTISQLNGLPSIPSRNQGEMSRNIGLGQEYPREGTYLQGTSTSTWKRISGR